MKGRETDLSLDERGKGQRDCIHGNIYQLKLLMLFLYGGIENKYSFRLDSEVIEGRKFDDLMFEYTEEDGKIFRLLQAKHRKDQTKRIFASELLTESDNDFSLIKYFFSYQDLKLEKIFQDGTIKDVIICTNINFDNDDLQRAGVSVEEIKEADKIFDIINVGNKQCVRYKFRKIPSLKPKLESYLLAKLARELLDRMLENKPIQHHQKNSIFYSYHLALAKEVVNVKCKNFHEDFIDNKNLSSEAKKFRGVFEKELITKTQSKITLKNLNEAIAGKSNVNEKLYMQLSKKFGPRKGQSPEWPQHVIHDKDIDDYLNHLVFAVNQPDEEELGSILKHKIGSGFNYITTEYLYDKVFQSMLKMLQGKEGKSFMTYVEAKELLEVGKREIFSYPSFQYQDELNHVYFNRNIRFIKQDKLQKFFSSQQLIWIIYSSTPWLRSLILYQELIKNKQNLKYLFIPSNYLQNNPDVICDFKESELFLVTCLLTEEVDHSEIKYIIDNFPKSISCSDQKTRKLIYITPYHNDITKTCTPNKYYYDEETSINFSDLTKESQILITREEMIRFQGSVKKQSIKELLELHEQEDAFQTEMEKLKLDSGDLEVLLKNRHVDVLKERPRFSDLESVHYKPCVRLKINQVIEAIEANPKDVFAFVGNENEVKRLIPSEQHILLKFNEIVSTFSTFFHPFILLDADKCAQQFKELCHMTDAVNTKGISRTNLSVIHLLKSSEKDWIWLQSYSRSIYIQRQFHAVLIKKEYLSDLLHNMNSCTFIIISGINQKDLCQELDVDNNFFEEMYNIFISQIHEKAKIRFHYWRKEINDEMNEKYIYWFKAKKSLDCDTVNFYWHQSEGDVSKIRKMIDRDVNHLLSEKDLVESKQRVNVLAGEAGVGKSFTLTHIAEEVKNMKPSSLVIKIELLKFQEVLSSKSCSSLSDAIDLLLHFANVEVNSFTKKFFTYMLLYTDGVKIFWDGFDELSPKRQDDSLKLFKTIQRATSASMWITTRLLDKEKLENELCVFAYTFSPVNNNIQTSILTQFWDTALKFSCKYIGQSFHNLLEKHANELLQYFHVKFHNVENFINNPLIMRMMAEIHLEKIKVSLTDCDNAPNASIAESLVIEDIYSAFVDKKYDIYLCEKLNVSTRLDAESLIDLKRQYTKAYGRLAVKVICSDFYFPKDCIHDKKEYYSLNTLSKIGLVEGEGNQPNFMHRTFAEYFATERITNKLKCSRISTPDATQLWEILLNRILVCPYGRRFFDDKLARDNEIQNLLTHSDQRDIIYSLILEQSRDVYSVLWYAGLDGLERTLNFLLKSAKNFDSLKEISLNLFEEGTINAHAHYILLIKTILNSGKDLDSTRVVELILMNKANLLYRAVFEDDLKTVDILIDYVKDSNKIVELITTGPCFEKDGKTALHVALENSNIDIVEKCIEKLNDTQRLKVLNMRDSRNKLPEDYATEKIKRIFYSRYERYFEITRDT